MPFSYDPDQELHVTRIVNVYRANRTTNATAQVVALNLTQNISECQEIQESQAGDAILINQRFPFVVVAGCTVCIAGIVSTLFLLFIFSKKSMRSHNNVLYLAILALFDVSILTNYILLIAVGIMKDYFRLLFLHRLYHWYMAFLFTLGRITQTSQTYLIVAATVERYMIVTRNSPFSLRRKTGVSVGCVASSRYMAIISVILLAIALRWSAYLEVTVKYSNCTGFQSIYFAHGEILDNKVYVTYNLYGSQVINVYVPFMLLLALNLLIFKRMRSTSGRHTDFKNQAVYMPNQLANQSRAILIRQTLDKRVLRDATNTMAAIVSGYLISNSLNVIITITEQLNMKWLYGHIELYTIAADVSSFCVIATSASRLPIYYWCNAKIRELIDQTCSRACVCRNQSKTEPYEVIASSRNGSLTQKLCAPSPTVHKRGFSSFSEPSPYQRCSPSPPFTLGNSTGVDVQKINSDGPETVTYTVPEPEKSDSRGLLETITTDHFGITKSIDRLGNKTSDSDYSCHNGGIYQEMKMVQQPEHVHVVTQRDIKDWINEVFL